MEMKTNIVRLVDLDEKTYNEVFKLNYGPDRIMAQQLIRSSDDPRSRIIIAEIDEKIVGVCHVFKDGSYYNAHTYVSRWFRRKRVGSELLKEAIAENYRMQVDRKRKSRLVVFWSRSNEEFFGTFSDKEIRKVFC